MKNKLTIIFLVLVIAFMIGAVVFLPKLFPKNTSQVSSEIESVASKVSSTLEKTYTLNEMISESDNVLLGTVIKADVDENGVLYTLMVSWSDVYKGRNYSTMGYAYLYGSQSLDINKTYLFIGDNNEEKYHYKEPFKNAPWVFLVEGESLTHCSNGNLELLSNSDEISIEEIKTICKNQTSSK